MNSRTRLALLAGVGACALPMAALAQESTRKDVPADEPAVAAEVVVTGTLIKGVAPAGSPVVDITAADVEQIGVTNATDLLRRLPQAGDFNSIPQPTTNSSIPYSPIQLRGVGGLSGMATLILLDGKRIVPTATGMNWIDTQMIPAGIIERVEVVTDGGSSIYGSDAVAGVVNFITKRKQDGFSVDASYGLGKGSYALWDVGATYGGDVGAGSFVLSYSYSDKKSLLGKDLDYLIENKTSRGGQDNRSASCNPGTITVNNTPYALPGRTAGTTNFCSAFDQLSYYPEERRHSIFGTLTQNFSDTVTLDVNAYWSQRKARVQDPANSRSSGTITSTNPYFSSVTGETSQSVAFSYEGAFGVRSNPSEYEAWQVSPTLTVDFTPEWSATFGLNHGRSDSDFIAYSLNGAAQTAALAATTQATALNPYNIGATNASVLAGIADFNNREKSHQEISEARVVLNGSLFELPAGEVKAAFGGEYRKEVYDHFTSQGTSAAPSITSDTQRDRKVKSVYGEVFVPVVTSLRLSLSARYDDYDDVGSTTNPKIGVTWEPTDWIGFRGSWGTSFHAPSLADLSATLGYQFFLPISPFRAATSPFFPDFFKPTFLLAGAKPGIKPEEATTYSFGTDIHPTESIRVGLTYWNIKYTDRIDQNAGFFFGPGYYSDPANAPYFILNPANPAAITAKFGDFPVIGFPNLQTLYTIFGAPYVVSDQRKQNLGALNLDGIDATFDFDHDLAGGTMHLGLNGSYMLGRDKENVRGSGFVDTLAQGDFNNPISPLNLTGTAGWRKGPFDASVTVYYRDGAKVGAERIDSYTTVALFAKYDVTSKVSATLNVDNVFDADPPFRLVTNGVAYINAGRLMRVGVAAKF